MRQASTTLTVSTPGRALIEITGEVAAWVRSTRIGEGLLTLLVQHTSAGLLITENASPAVWRDTLRWFEDVAPEDAGYEHDDEGPDDMPAHIRTLLSGNSLAMPVSQGTMRLGKWQGLFLAEYRRRPHRRSVALHLIGE